MAPELFTPYKRPIRPIHTGFEESVTEQTFVNVGTQIERMKIAGERLKIFKDNYHFPDERSVEMSFEDVTQTPGFDMADASMLNRAAQDSIRAQNERAMEEAIINAGSREPATEPEGNEGGE